MKPDVEGEPDRQSPAEKEFRIEYCAIAQAFYAIGADEHALAEALSVPAETFETWRTQHPEFASACEAGKDAADEAVERALLRRSNGYFYQAEKPSMRKGEGFTIPYRAHVLPDVAAAQFWMFNRDPQEWKRPASIPLPPPENPWPEIYKQLLGNVLLPREPSNWAEIETKSDQAIED